jgi:hypothetical protein
LPKTESQRSRALIKAAHRLEAKPAYGRGEAPPRGRGATCSRERSAARRLALVDVAHWASEWPWCAQAPEAVRGAALGDRVEVTVSNRRTDPWSIGAAEG